ETLTTECVRFQLDLSCLVDGELDEKASARAITHLEECDECHTFFHDVREQVQAHSDLGEGEALIAQYTTLVGAAPTGDVETIELVNRLASIFYQLGKAYVCAGLDEEYRDKVLGHNYIYERAVLVSSTKNTGRGFVDGVLERGRDDAGGLDWSNARHMLNGQLEAITDPLEKGRRLLNEAIQADSTFEEPRLYLAYLDGKEGKPMRAARGYQQVFDTGIDETNRAHAAVQLSLLHAEEGDFKKAIALNRWVLASGVEGRDSRFFFVHFNIGMYYIALETFGKEQGRCAVKALASFRRLLDRHLDRVDETVALIRRSPKLTAAIEVLPGFAEQLVASCPELFSSTQGEDQE
ncbi:MAG: hypothetical protein ACI8PQ_001967, partial [Planctomycetota bacterium]